jgi:tripartite-type tricarboxylate transporter receptor subunit TctC
MYNSRSACAAILFVFIVLLAAGPGVGPAAGAESRYPSRAIDIIVPVVPGAGADFCARILAESAKKKWNVPVNVLNKPGGNSVPANLEVHQAKPDGYTLLADSQSSCSFLEVSTPNLPFKVLDRTFVAIATASPHVMYVPASFPANNLKELEAEIKKDPGNFTWATYGGVGAGDFFMRQFFKAIGVDVAKTKPVVVRGSAEGLTLAAGGHIKLSSGSPAPGLPHVKAGNVKAIAITGHRFSEYPDVATTAEQGYPGANAIYWWGISAPPNLPAPIIAAWDEVIQEMLKDPAIVAKLKNIGFAPFYRNSNASKELVRKEMEEAQKLWGVR